MLAPIPVPETILVPAPRRRSERIPRRIAYPADWERDRVDRVDPCGVGIKLVSEISFRDQKVKQCVWPSASGVGNSTSHTRSVDRPLIEQMMDVWARLLHLQEGQQNPDAHKNTRRLVGIEEICLLRGGRPTRPESRIGCWRCPKHRLVRNLDDCLLRSR